MKAENPDDSIGTVFNRLIRDIIQLDEHLKEIKEQTRNWEDDENLEKSLQALSEATYISGVLQEIRLRTLTVQENSKDYGLMLPRRSLMEEINVMIQTYKQINYNLWQRVDVLRKKVYGQRFDYNDLKEEIKSGLIEGFQMLKKYFASK